MSPPSPTLARQYVMRCTDCQHVRGVSAFRVQRTGGRSPVCIWCEQRIANEAAKDLAALRKQLRKFRRHEGILKGHLSRLRDRIRDAEVELDRIERPAPRRQTA